MRVSQRFRAACDDLAQALGAGGAKTVEIAFRRFARATERDLHAIATAIHRRWTPGPDVCVEDVRQEMLAWIWQQIPHYDAERSPDFAAYLLWNAVHFSKREVHKARGASTHGSADRAPSNLPVTSIEAMVNEGFERGDGTRVPSALVDHTDPAEHLELVRRDKLATASLRTAEEFYVYRVFRESFDVETAAETIAAEGRAHTPDAARRVIMGLLRSIAERVERVTS